MLRNPNKFYKAIENELIDTGESYESYCYNVYHGKVWGDDLVAAAISDMWNISISIISPCYKYPVDVWHNENDPHVVLIANGGSYMSHSNKTTHFSSTRKIDGKWKIPGTELINHTVGINPTLVYKRLEPRILDNKEHARKIAIEEYVNLEKEKSLELLCDITKQIYRLDKHISHLIQESDVKKDSQRQIAYKLECLGISAEKIAIATQQKDLPYMLTEDQECEEVRADRKRKFEEEAKEEERKRQRRETIVMKDGKIISGGDKSQEAKDATHSTTLTVQQQRIMKDQESLIQRQDTQLIQLNLRIKALETEKAELIAKQQQQDQQLQLQQQQQHPPLPTIPSLSNIAGLPLLDDDVIEFTDLTAGAGQTLLTPVISPVIPPAIPTPLPPAEPGTSSQSTESSNPFNIKRAIKPEHLKFLPKYALAGLKKEPQSSAEIVDQSNVEVLNLPPEGASNIIFVPKKIDQKKALVLVPQTRKRFLNKRNNPGAPVPEDAQDPTRFYCPNCACVTGMIAGRTATDFVLRILRLMSGQAHYPAWCQLNSAESS